MLATPRKEHDALVPVLERMRVPHDGVLVVHSAIARLSRHGFRAEGMIEALLAYLRAGTLVMPTMTWRTVTPQCPVWDELQTRSETGIMTEIFRTRYASKRSIHPTHSVAAQGVAAEFLVSRHHYGDTPVSADSPYGLMRSHQAYVMMIGVGLESCTAIHLPEELIAPEVYLRPLDTAEIYRCTDRNEQVHRLHARRHSRLDRDFPKFGPPLERSGLMHSGHLDGCPYAIVALHDLLNAVTAALVADPRGTIKARLPVSE